MSANAGSSETNGLQNGEVSHIPRLQTENSVDGSTIISSKISAKRKQAPPPIRHITDNFVPLSTLVNRLVQYAYSELLILLETLPSQSELDKKKLLLDHCLSLRQQFIKLYVLTHWARNAEEVSRCIDIVAFLEGQKNCFQNAVSALRHLRETMLGATIRNPDIDTAVDVLSTGTFPRLLNRAYLKPPPITPETTLSTLRLLDTTLSLRLALHETLPPEFLQYTIANGRVTFKVQDEYEVDISVASEDMKSRWFVIDFRWDFQPTHPLTDLTRTEIERLGNEALERGLSELYETLHSFALSFKLTLFYDQAKKLAAGKWSLNVDATYQKRNVIITYWKSSPTGRNAIEIGVERLSSNIAVKWIREGILADSDVKIDLGNISAGALLSRVTTLHGQITLNAIRDAIDFVPARFRDADTLMVQLTHSRLLQITVNNANGKIVLRGRGSSHIYTTAAQKLNAHRANAKGIFVKLRSLALQEDIETIAKAVGWDTPRLEGLKPAEVLRFTEGSKDALFLRRPSWARQWLLMGSVSLEGTRWWIVEINRYVLSFEFVQELPIPSLVLTDYALLEKLHELATARIAYLILSRSLLLQGYHTSYANFTILDRMQIPVMRIDSFESSVLVKFVGIVGDQFQLCIQGRMQKIHLGEAPSLEDDVIFDAENGRFAILLRLSLDEDIVQRLMSRWQQVALMGSYFKVIQKTALEIVTVRLEAVVARYYQRFSVAICLRDGKQFVEFPDPTDPSRRMLPFVTKLLRSDGLGVAIERLQASAPFLAVMDTIECDGMYLLVHGAGDFKLEFSEKKHALRIQYRKKRRESMFYIYDLGVSTTNDGDYTPMASCRSLWQEERTGVVPFDNGLACDVSVVGDIVKEIHQRVFYEH